MGLAAQALACCSTRNPHCPPHPPALLTSPPFHSTPDPPTHRPHLQDGVPVPVVITAFTDKTFTYVMKTPPASYFIKKAAGVESGSGKPGHSLTSAISLKHLYEIALVKQKDVPHVPLEAVCNSLVGTCRSMGVRVVQRPGDL